MEWISNEPGFIGAAVAQFDTIGADMEIVSASPLSVASLAWRQSASTWALTVVCKATFLLRPGQTPLAPEQEEVLEADAYWNDDPARSLHAATDLVPMKPRADVVLVGQAFAPGGAPARSLVTRLQVGTLNKAVEVCCDRVFARDGSLHDGPRFTRMPLVYERAAGGPETSNPVGIRPGGLDAKGQAPVPNLLPPGAVVARPTDVLPPIGFGPIAPSWPSRRAMLGRHAGTWSVHELSRQPLPRDIDLAFFNVAPPDQQLPNLRGDERVVLENLLPDQPSFATRLPGLHPRATVEVAQGQPRPIPLYCDTLWIDTNRALCTLTWRGRVALERPDAAGRVVITVESSVPAGHRPAVELEEDDEAPVGTSLIVTEGGPALPFARGAAAPPPPATSPRAADVALPFAPRPPPPPAPPPPAAIEIAPPPPVSSSFPALAGGATAAVSPWASKAQPSAGAAAPTAVSAATAVAVAEAVPVRVPLRPAARAETREMLQLLWYEADSVPRIRRTSAWRPILDEAEERPLDADLDDPALEKEPLALEDRRDVFEILARGAAVDAPAVTEALAAAVRDDGKYLAPLVLIAGELSFPFDEIEALRATVITITPLAGTDEALRGPLETAKELLGIPSLYSAPAVPEGMTARIKEAFAQGKRVVPAGYLEAQTERALLERRAYQRREVFGKRRIRALLSAAGSSHPIPTYLAEETAKMLPMFQRFPARIIAEVHPAVDQYEAHAAALRVLAIARTGPAPRR